MIIVTFHIICDKCSAIVVQADESFTYQDESIGLPEGWSYTEKEGDLLCPTCTLERAT
jgi:hypothetical protein